jgi:hypothetical protein
MLHYGLAYLILLGLIWLDRSQGRPPARPYLVVIAAWIVHQITFFLVF